MRREYQPIIDDALWSAYERGKADKALPYYVSGNLIEALGTAGFEIVRKPAEGPGIIMETRTTHADGRVEVRTNQPTEQAAPAEPIQALYSVRVGWPEFRSLSVACVDGVSVAMVTRAAKVAADERHPERADRTRWVAFSWQQKRFLAPDEPAPYHFAIGPYEVLVRECRPPELPEAASLADLKRYEGRWEDGLRNIVTILHGPSYSFEIDQIVEEVRALRDVVAPIDNEKERRTEHMTFDEDGDCWTLSGDPDTVERVLDLVKKGEAAVKAEREPEIVIKLGEDSLYLHGTPDARAALMQFLLKEMPRFAKGDVSPVRRAT
ncbi:hypothetical protein MKK55_18025 [Methylobacterium sp. J-059]|uniref:hypothetical protein n=1 Tax=Methylobacterium sp. J-059 TaxID=2836643 RepID=UPI001FBA19FA|nr:hypothetical protein [Methylobacterium sp. J-059]MCJ2040831.1 hypothetical protein [Methylobacterium sp. J-059]